VNEIVVSISSSVPIAPINVPEVPTLLETSIPLTVIVSLEIEIPRADEFKPPKLAIICTSPV